MRSKNLHALRDIKTLTIYSSKVQSLGYIPFHQMIFSIHNSQFFTTVTGRIRHFFIIGSAHPTDCYRTFRFPKCISLLCSLMLQNSHTHSLSIYHLSPKLSTTVLENSQASLLGTLNSEEKQKGICYRTQFSSTGIIVYFATTYKRFTYQRFSRNSKK